MGGGLSGAGMTLISNHEFVVAWMNSSNLEEVARATGLSWSYASTKATLLRKKGVRLPRLYQGRPGRTPKDWQLEVAQLNSLIKKHIK